MMCGCERVFQVGHGGLVIEPASPTRATVLVEVTTLEPYCREYTATRHPKVSRTQRRRNPFRSSARSMARIGWM